MGAMQRTKGAAGEREVATIIRDLTDEQWRPVTIDGGFWNDRYEVSDLGRVRTTNGTWKGKRPGQRILAQRPNDDGYLRVEFTKEGRRKFAKVHSLVASAFLGKMPDGMTVNHINGTKMQNALSNLEYLSRKENVQHSWRIGLRDETPRRISESRRLGIERRKA